MWCRTCQTDMTIQMSEDRKRIFCTKCGSDLSLTGRHQEGNPSAEAREILERLRNENLDPEGDYPPKRPKYRYDSAHEMPGVTGTDSSHFQPPPPRHQLPHAQSSSASNPGAQQPTSSSQDWSGSASDYPHQSHAAQSPGSESISSHSDSSSGGYQQPPGGRYGAGDHTPEAYNFRIDSAHEMPSNSPHFDVQTAILNKQKQQTNWLGLLGQLLAYIGVIAITAGTVMVVVGYFGGPEKYTPTGWLTATIGQMFLFLGVVTLISTGMEQTSDEVSQRVEILGSQLLRIEKSHQDFKQKALSGAHFYSASRPRADSPQSDDRHS